jgi:single-strand DNA-binding protein
MNETFVTFHGWAGSDVRHRDAKGVSVATFRVAVTPRLKKEGSWVDGETAWYTVTAWRTLADHVADSIRKGDPVIVHGRLRTETWRPDEGPSSTTLHVEASLVGHDLTRGISHFIKRPERRSDEPAGGANANGASVAVDSTAAAASEDEPRTERPGDHLAA